MSASSETMRAVRIKGEAGPPSALYIGEYEKPSPKEGQILVKIRAIGVNRMDSLQRMGKYPLPPQAGPILGVEFSGHVEQSKSDKWTKGQEVFGLAYGGAYAEFIAISGDMVLQKPEYLSHSQAAGILEVFLTAYQALEVLGELKPEESVLIHAGASSVGIAANQLAPILGATKVFTTAGSQEKLDALLHLKSPPTRGINYKTENFEEIVLKETNNQGVNLIIDFIGKDYLEKNINSLAKDGRMICLGAMSGAEANVSIGKIIYKRLRIQGSTLRSRDPSYQSNLVARFNKDCMSHFVPDGELQSIVNKELDWSKVIEAHEMLDANQNIGKIILTIPE
ncbi:quinone oxidoreductase [Phaffia rhodozyma]|uniref:Quinone oxidoreductase n=1 Tax=Phaffia rhodozyma TaxID=264483 RepID=A0A0F7SX33_PHARH|nr:quinone oxidoreductase [Phaffia rhodozyma]